MGFRDRVQDLSVAEVRKASEGAGKARANLEERGITTHSISSGVKGVAKGGMTIAQAGLTHARTELELRGADLSALYAAVLDGALASLTGVEESGAGGSPKPRSDR